MIEISTLTLDSEKTTVPIILDQRVISVVATMKVQQAFD